MSSPRPPTTPPFYFEVMLKPQKRAGPPERCQRQVGKVLGALFCAAKCKSPAERKEGSEDSKGSKQKYRNTRVLAKLWNLINSCCENAFLHFLEHANITIGGQAFENLWFNTQSQHEFDHPVILSASLLMSYFTSCAFKGFMTYLNSTFCLWFATFQKN